MRYLEVTVRCRREAAPAVEAVLQPLGGGVAIEDPLDVADAIATGRWDYTDLVPGDTAWVTLRCYLPEATDLESRRQALDHGLARVRAEELGEVNEPVLTWVDEEDWANNWKAYYKPLRIGRRLMVVPTWEEYRAQPDDLVMRLDPGMAFGTGTHATTSLCLAWLEDLVAPGATVVDVGTGSAILALGAALLGARAVLACDTDPVAVRVAAENLERNGALDRVQVELGPLEAPACEAWLDEHTPDLIVANIIADVIVPLTPRVVSLLPQGGRFLCSGIIDHRKDDVIAALQGAGLRLDSVQEEGGWVAMLARKP